MKKLLFLFALISITIAQAQSTRNDSYSAMGIVTSFKDIPIGFGVYTIEKGQKFGFYTHLKWNKLSFDSDYNYLAGPVPRDTLRDRIEEGGGNLIKMINIGTVFNPQQFGIMQWDFIDIDFCVALGYIQDFRYQFYNDVGGIEESEDGTISYAKPLGKYYVNDFNKNGLNLNIGTNISLENKRLMLHISYDFRPKLFALGLNWKVK
ncbi:MAG: hypothetical protein QMC03_05680 [Flavobacteriales bacterium]|jgi:hypothetical protein